MTPEQRDTCRAIEREGKKINDEINALRTEEQTLRDERRLISDTIATNKREIAKLQRDRTTACLLGPRRRSERPMSLVGDGLGVLDCFAKLDRIQREIDGLKSGMRVLEQELQRIDRRLETIRRLIAGKMALFPILRRQKESAGCP